MTAALTPAPSRLKQVAAKWQNLRQQYGQTKAAQTKSGAGTKPLPFWNREVESTAPMTLYDINPFRLRQSECPSTESGWRTYGEGERGQILTGVIPDPSGAP